MKKITLSLCVCLLLQAALVPAIVGVSVVGVLPFASLLLLCQCCCQQHCLADTVVDVPNVACIPAITGILKVCSG
jgi:hypothetical protein